MAPAGLPSFGTSHKPLHALVVRPVVDPKYPASHAPVHVLVVSPVAFPKKPASHSLQVVVPVPPLLHVPAKHGQALQSPVVDEPQSCCEEDESVSFTPQLEGHAPKQQTKSEESR